MRPRRGDRRRPGKLTGEHALLRGLHGRLRPGDILVADAYYSSYDEVMTLRRLGVDVVMRQTGNRRSDFRRGTRLGREDHLVEWHRDRNRRPWMSRAEFAALPRVMAMRELRVRVEQPGFRTRSFVVVTTLLDPEAFPRRELAAVYRARWHCELDIRSLKQTLKMDVLRCKTPAMVRKEFWAHLLAANLIRGVMAEAARRHGLPPAGVELPGGAADDGGVPGGAEPGGAGRGRGPGGGDAGGAAPRCGWGTGPTGSSRGW